MFVCKTIPTNDARSDATDGVGKSCLWVTVQTPEFIGRDWDACDTTDAEHVWARSLPANWAQQNVVLDLANVWRIDSSAIGFLVATAQMLQQAGGHLALAQTMPHVQEVLDRMRLNDLLPLLGDVLTADQNPNHTNGPKPGPGSLKHAA